MKSKSGIAPVALALFITLIAVALALGNKAREPGFWEGLQSAAFTLAFRLGYNIIPPLAVLAIIFHYKRNRGLCLAALGMITINAVTLVIRAFAPRPTSYWSRSAVDYLIDIPQMYTDPWFLVPALTLLSCRFRGKLDRLRIAALILTAMIPSTIVAGYWLYGELFRLLEILVQVAYTAAGGICVWCMVFRRQDEPNRPPVDSSRDIALTCPRCGAAQIIPSGHGQCSNCRLQITISLAEGVCRKCRYPLRGLTGENCPECGTPIAAVATPM